MEKLVYASSVDAVSPLYADMAWIADGRRKPLLAVMHGFGGGRDSVSQDIQELASVGMFCVAPDMRGRGDSSGEWDAGGLDVHDIVDSLLAAIRKQPDEIDRTNINIVGYSGGGGNCYLAATRFPDLFHVAAPFFGISDYGLWYETMGRPDCNETMRKVLGGSPSEKPAVYAARNACLAAGNARATRWHIFWDEKEEGCPPVLNEKFIEAHRAAGLRNATPHRSRVNDKTRWIHGYRSHEPQLGRADRIFCREILSKAPDLSLPVSGELTVCGYLVTRHFQVFVEDGRRGVVKIRYHLKAPKPEIMIVDNPENLRMTVSDKSPLADLAAK